MPAHTSARSLARASRNRWPDDDAFGRYACLVQRLGAPRGALDLVTAVFRFGRTSGVCCPSQATLGAAAGGMSARTVRRLLPWLRKHGIITATHRHGWAVCRDGVRRRVRRSSLYRLRHRACPASVPADAKAAQPSGQTVPAESLKNKSLKESNLRAGPPSRPAPPNGFTPELQAALARLGHGIADLRAPEPG